jgi:serine/threonine protein kinase
MKPANLLVDSRGNLWITDFDVARCKSQAGLTMSGDLVRTLRYMSPGQALAKRVLVDHRTDIYSLGATAQAQAINDFLIDDLLNQASPFGNPVGAKVTVRELLDRAAQIKVHP